MCRRRNKEALTQLCSGPGKLTQALGVDGSGHGLDCFRGKLLTLRGATSTPRIVQTHRIGISKATGLPWRFYREGSAHVNA